MESDTQKIDFQNEDSRRNGTTGGFNGSFSPLNDTQVIQNDTLQTQTQNSQTTRTGRLRMLNESEGNEIVDSSCDFKDSISTQLIVDKDIDFEMDDTAVIEAETQAENNAEHDKTTQQDTESPVESPTVPFKFKFPATTDSPWANNIKDAFPNSTDSQTPWLNKIKDPFKETPLKDTPAFSKIRNPFEETPIAASRISRSFNTPTTKAHSLFQELRENQDMPELEVESQLAPKLTFGSELHSPNQDDVRTQDPLFSLDNLPLMNNTNDNQGDAEIEEQAQEETIDTRELSLIEGDTAPIDFPQTKSSHPLDKLTIEDSQADLQVLGTAPDMNDTSIDTQGDNDDVDENEDDDDVHSKSSSPVVSDDEKAGSNIERQLEVPYFAEDSILKYHRDLENKANIKLLAPPSLIALNEPLLRVNSLPIPTRNSSSQMAKKTPTTGNFMRSQTTIEAKNSSPHQVQSSSSKAEISEDITKSLPEPSNNEVDYEFIGENITQDFSDIDDESKVVADESKVDNTFEEEDAKTTQIQLTEENQTSLTPISARRRKRRRNVIESPNLTKRSRYLEPDTDDSEFDDDKEEEKQAEKEKEEEGNYDDDDDDDDDEKKVSRALEENISQTSNMNDHCDDNELSDATNVSYNFPEKILRQEPEELNKNDIICKSSVLCQYTSKIFPGVVTSHSEKGFNVRFGDGRDDVVDAVYPLDLRIEDHVKFESKNYVITGLECYKPEDSTVIRCIRGYDTIHGKKFRGKGKNMKLFGEEELFAIGDVIIETGEWHKRKRYGVEDDLWLLPKRFLDKDLITLGTYKDKLIMSTPTQHELKTQPGTSSFFSKCLFVITGMTDDEKVKSTALIEQNGGAIVEDGFASLIDIDGSRLKPKKLLSDYRFAAVITNKFSRSPKYLEALALGWPLLSYKFIERCVFESKLLKNITSYLLPAGESKELRTTKSSDIAQFLSNWQLDYSLADQLSNNRILEDIHVFLASKSNKTKLAEFMFCSLGATVDQLSFTTHSNLVSRLSKCDGSRILIYHDHRNSLETSLTSMDSTNKKGRRPVMITDTITTKNGIKVDLIDWEWVVQCIIDGFALESKQRTVN